MEEIKFKAWYEKGNILEDVVCVDFSGTEIRTGEPCVVLNNHSGCFPLKDVELMQYTGVKIEDDIEIYEDYIIEYKYYSAHKRWWSDTSEIPKIEKEVQKQKDNYRVIRKQVKFREGVFRIAYDIDLSDVKRGEKRNSMKGTSGDIEQKAWGFKLIGNIHQNPELLNE